MDKNNFYRRSIRPSHFQPRFIYLLILWSVVFALYGVLWISLTEYVLSCENVQNINCENKSSVDVMDKYFYAGLIMAILWSCLILMAYRGFINPLLVYQMTTYVIIFMLMLITSFAIHVNTDITWENTFWKELTNVFILFLSAMVWYMIIIDGTHLIKSK